MSTPESSGSAVGGRSIQDYVEALLRRWWLMLTIFVAVMTISVVITANTKPTFSASATIMISRNAGNDILSPGSTNMFYNFDFSQINNHVALLNSRLMSDRVANMLADSGGPVGGYSVNASSVRETDIIRISATAASPDIAVVAANAYVDVYQAYNLETSRTDVSAVREFVEDQLGIVRDRLNSSEQNLQAFKNQHKFVDLTSEISNLIGQQSTIAAALENTSTDLRAKEAQLANVRSMIDQQSQGMSAKLENISSPLVSNLKASLDQLEVEKTNLLIQGYTDQSPRIQSLNRQISDIRGQLSSESRQLVEQQGFIDPVGRLRDLVISDLNLENDLLSLRSRLASLRTAQSTHEAELQKLPETERLLARLTRDVETDRRIYSLLSERQEEARISEVGRVSTVRVIDRARYAGKIRPNVQSNILLGFFLALAIAVASAFAVDYTDTSVRSPEALERRGFSVLANVPLLARDRRSKAAGITSHLLTHTSPESSGAEAFRMLRTSIQFASMDKPIKTIMVTSSGPLEGKSTVAVNLATVLAQAGNRTLLVDADLRRPMLHRVFDQKRKPGFTDLILSGGSSPETAIFATPVDRLFCLPSGFTPPSPADVLSSSAADALLNRLKQEYDCIVLDSPPSLIAADSAILSTKADATILVVRAGRTSIEAIQQTEKLVRQAGGRFLGAVLNCVRYTRRRGYYYYYHYYRYRYTHRPTPMTTASPAATQQGSGTSGESGAGRA